MKASGMTRFDTRLSIEMKQYFEHAADLGGFKTLSEFVIFSVKAQAEKIIEKHNAILASQRDQEIFFNAVTNPGKPNEALKKAAARYKRLSNKK
jgi:uncharacterized protein (DUF1778 family)